MTHSFTSMIMGALLLLSSCCISAGLKGQDIRRMLVQSDVFYYQDNPTKALEIAKQAGAITLKDSGEHTAIYAEITGLYYSMNYEKLRRLDSAEYYYLKGIELYRKLGLVEDTTYATVLVNLGNMYNTKMQMPNSAGPYLEEAWRIIEKYMSEQNEDYMATVNNLALYHYNMGQYSKAEANYGKCIALIEKYRSKNSSLLLMPLTNLGEMYKQMGDYEKAYNTITKSINLQQAKRQTNTQVLMNWLLLLNELSMFAKQKSLTDSINTILEQLKQAGSDSNRINASIAINTITQAVFTNNPQKAIKTYELFTSKGYAKYLPNSIEAFANVQNLVCEAYVQAGKLDDAARLIDSSMKNSMRIYGKNKLPLWNAQFQQANILMLKKDYPAAKKVILQLNNNVYDTARYFIDGLTESQKTAIISKLKSFTSSIGYYLSKTGNNDNELVSLLFNIHLYFKNLLLTEKIRLKKYAQQNPKAYVLYNQLMDTRNQLGKLYLYDKLGDNLQTKELLQQEEVLEQALKGIIAEIKYLQNNQNNWQHLQKKLLPGENVIAFVKYSDMQAAYQLKTITYYSALILTAGHKPPQYVSVCSELEIYGLLAACNAGELKTSYANLVRVQAKYNGKKIIPKQEIYNLIWGKIAPHIKEKQKVYYFPNGLLQVLPFEAFADEKNLFLRDKYQLNQLQNFTTLFTRGPSQKKRQQTVEIWGNIDYSRDATTKFDINKIDTTNCICKPLTPLGETEINIINAALNKHQFTTQQFTGDTASELKFKTMAHRSDILHISTHGFYRWALASEDQYTNVWSNLSIDMINPVTYFLKSGIVFAGANKQWGRSAEKSPLDNNTDGILFSYEVKDIDLSSIELVIVSACETGLGTIVYDEGIVGLHSAFKLAGVNKIITALWDVGKPETEAWMKTFYTHYNIKQNVEEAYDATQREMSKISPPYSWAGFLLTK